MKPVFSKTSLRGLCFSAGALLLSAAIVSAQTPVTFQVDMSDNPLTAGQSVSVNGAFDGWSGNHVMSNNPEGANPNLYSATVTDVSVAKGSVMDWQYRILSGSSTISYSSQADGDNYCATIPTNGALATPSHFWSDDGPGLTYNITFQVDMAEQLHLGNFNPNTMNVYCQGSFEGWSDANFPLTNNAALNVTNGEGYVTSMPYQGTFTTWTACSNAAAEYKFVYNNGADVYEGPTTGDPDNNNNRFFVNASNQTLPMVSFSDKPFNNTVTNNVTFIVDMQVQEFYSAFNPNTQQVEIFGDYNNWNGGTVMANTNPANTNLFYTTIQYIGGAGTPQYYKYQIDPGGNWENPAASNLIGGNRYFDLGSTSGNLVVGPVYFSDQSSFSMSDLVTVTNCEVTFTVDMSAATNAASTYNSGGPFVLGFDTVYLNGLNNGNNDSFWGWGPLDAPPQYQMTEVGDTALYTITLPVNQGQPLNIQYDYGIDGNANEPNGNHFHYIRSLPNYSMPTDLFGAPAPQEPSFGNLAVNSGAGNITLSWLGRPGVQLQKTSSLTSPIVWTPLPLTDGTNLTVNQGPGSLDPVGYASTNYPVTGSAFFELIGPP